MPENIFVRVNGRGNAWPVFIGSKHPFYNSKDSSDLANASYSIFGMETDELNYEKISWSILVDAGNHTAPYIIKNENRIPEAVFLTHPHMDHTLGVDWIAQSKYYLSGKKEKYPVYGSLKTLAIFKEAYPHLKDVVQFKELVPGKGIILDEVPGMQVTAFPVFHGKGGLGASMLYFEYSAKKRSFLFTGDMLCPLLRKADYDLISKAQFAFIDANNRYSYPLSNHSSFVKNMPGSNKVSTHLLKWLEQVKFSDLLAPHLDGKSTIKTREYFDQLLNDYESVDELPFCILDFAKQTNIPIFNLIHYGGFEDLGIYNEALLSLEEMIKWTSDQAAKEGFGETEFRVPIVGDIIKVS